MDTYRLIFMLWYVMSCHVMACHVTRRELWPIGYGYVTKSCVIINPRQKSFTKQCDWYCPEERPPAQFRSKGVNHVIYEAPFNLIGDVWMVMHSSAILFDYSFVQSFVDFFYAPAPLFALLNHRLSSVFISDNSAQPTSFQSLPLCLRSFHAITRMIYCTLCLCV